MSSTAITLAQPANTSSSSILQCRGPLPSPEVIGPYRVVSLLGQGGMGEVYRAEEPSLQRQVAVKVLRARLADDAEAKMRFLHEARAQASVEHDHVVPIYQVGESDGQPYIAMPLLKGETLGALLARFPVLAVSEVVRIGREIAEGLAAAHERGLVHRDIKPANIWLEGPRRWVKILDFGLARTTQGTSPNRLTQEGTTVGTPEYMSPEQAQGHALDARSDLYSLGVLLYQMVTGDLPFTGANTMALFCSVLTEAPAPPIVKNPSVPSELNDLIVRLVAKVPGDRYNSALELADELRRIELASPDTARILVTARVPIDCDPTDPETPLTTAHVQPATEVVWTPRRRLVLLLGGWAVAAVALVIVLHGKLFPPDSRDDRSAAVVTDPAPTLAAAPTPTTRKLGHLSPEEQRWFAELILDHGGFVVLDSGKEVKLRRELPPTMFSLKSITLNDAPADLWPQFFLRAARAKGLVDLYINAHSITADEIALLARGPAAETLEALYTGDWTAPPEALDPAGAFPNLFSLVLKGPGLTDAVLAKLERFPSMRAIYFFSCPITAEGLRSLQKLPLTFAHFNDCPAITNAGVAELAKIPTLRDLLLYKTQITPAGIVPLANLPALRIVTIHEPSFTDAAVPHLAKLRPSETLCVQGTTVTETGAKKLAEALPTVRIQWWSGEMAPLAQRPLTPAEVRTLAEETLRYGGDVDLEDGTKVQAVDKLPQSDFALRTVNARGVPDAAWPAYFGRLRRAAGLHCIDVQARDLTADEFVQLSYSPSAKTLEQFLIGYWKDSPDARAALARFPNVFLFNLNGPAVTDDVVAAMVGAMPSVRMLYLSDGAFTNAGLARLVKLRITWLSLRNNPKLTPTGFATLAGHPTLEHLQLKPLNTPAESVIPLHVALRCQSLEFIDPALTDDAISYLSATRPTKQLLVAETGITEVGAKLLAAAQPTVKVKWRGGEIAPVAAATTITQPELRAFVATTLKYGGGIELRAGVHVNADRPLPPGDIEICAVSVGNIPEEVWPDYFRQLCRINTLIVLNVQTRNLTAAEFARFGESHGPQITQLLIGDWPSSPEALAALRRMKRLGLFTLNGPQVTDAVLAAVAELPTLTFLYLRGGMYTATGLAALRKAPLTGLNIQNTPKLTGDGVAALAAIPTLAGMTFDTVNCPPEMLARFSGAAPCRSLYLHGPELKDDAVPHLSRMRALETMDVTNTAITEVGAKQLAAAKPTITVKWRGGTIAPFAAPPLSPAEHRKLAELTIRLGGHVAIVGGSDNVRSVDQLPKGDFAILRLIVDNVPDVEWPTFFGLVCRAKGLTSLAVYHRSLTDAEFRRLAESRLVDTLATLMLGDWNISPKSLDLFSKFACVDNLSLTGANVTDDVLAALHKLPKLDHLYLTNGTFTDTGLRHLEELNLWGIHFIGCRGITDRGVDSLAKMKALKSVLFTETKVTPAGVERLAANATLKRVHYYDIAANDSAVAHLSKLTGVELIDVSRTAMTGTGAKRLAEALPKVRIDWSGGTIAPKMP